MIDNLNGIPIRISKYLPKTTNDKDGNDVPLMGVMVEEIFYMTQENFDLMTEQMKSHDDQGNPR